MKYLNKIIEYGLYLLVFLLPIQTRWIIKSGEINNGYWEYGTYSLYGTDILLLIILLLFIIVIASGTKWSEAISRTSSLYKMSTILKFDIPEIASSSPAKFWRGTPRNDSGGYVWWIIVGLDLAVFVSIFFAADKVLALFYYSRFLLGIGLFWLVVNAHYDRIKIIWSLLAGFLLQAGLGIWQFLSQTTFVNKWLGLALHRAGDLGTSVIETVGAGGVGERWLRAYGGLDHPNILGGMLAVGIILLIYFILINEKRFRITNYELRITNLGYNIRKSILWLMLVLFFVALFFSFSRAAWLAVLAGLVVIIVLTVLIKNLRWQKGLAEIILLLGVLAFLLFNQYQNLVETRSSVSLLASGRLENKSNIARLESYKNSWQLIKNNWLMGVGAGNYTLALKNKLAENLASYDYQPAHNVFLLVWAETGIVGLLFFIILFLYLLISNFKFLISNQCPIFNNPIINIGIIIFLLIIIIFDHWLWSLHFGILFFWLIIGLVYRRGRDTPWRVSRDADMV